MKPFCRGKQQTKGKRKMKTDLELKIGYLIAREDAGLITPREKKELERLKEEWWDIEDGKWQ
jgi:hypothetical protein